MPSTLQLGAARNFQDRLIDEVDNRSCETEAIHITTSVLAIGVDYILSSNFFPLTPYTSNFVIHGRVNANMIV